MSLSGPKPSAFIVIVLLDHFKTIHPDLAWPQGRLFGLHSSFIEARSAGAPPVLSGVAWPAGAKLVSFVCLLVEVGVGDTFCLIHIWQLFWRYFNGPPRLKTQDSRFKFIQIESSWPRTCTCWKPLWLTLAVGRRRSSVTE